MANSFKGAITSETFDGVMVCNGHHSEPMLPHFEGADMFRGIQMHSHMYRTSASFENKRVIVVGMSNSGADIATELTHVCSQVYLSTRQGAWIFPRMINGGIPFDSVINKRCIHVLPRLIKNFLLERFLTRNFDHQRYGLRPKHAADAQVPLLNDELPKMIGCGRIIVKPNIKIISEAEVAFEDGSSESDIDAIIYATGYILKFPFLKQLSYKVKDNVPNLYKFVFAPDVKPPTLAIIGCIQPFNSYFPISELQSRWAVAVFQGERILPSEEQMQNEIKNRRLNIARRNLNSLRYTTFVDWSEYNDELAKEIDCKPEFVKLLTSDPWLALSVFTGPCIPSHYRLTGKGAWSGARDAILTTHDRIVKPMNQKHIATNGNHRAAYITMFLGIPLIMIFIGLLIFHM